MIFTLIYSHGFFMQSRNFRLQKVGNIDWLEKHFQLQKISFSLDELIVLNASKENKSMELFAQMIDRLTNNVFIPIAAGGGINSLEDAEKLFHYGADKIVLNTALFKNPYLVKQLVYKYGSQSIIAAIDYRKNEGKNEVFITNGTEKIDMDFQDYVSYVEQLGVGEIYLNSINQDGTGFGYDFVTINQIIEALNIPLIIAGGAGNEAHLLEGLQLEKVSAVATANLFNFLGDSLPKARKIITQQDINIAAWEEFNLRSIESAL